MSNTLSRREFFKASTTYPGAVAWVNWPSWMPRLAIAPKGENLSGDILLVIFLRGAADTLNLIVPHGEDRYYELRPTLNIAPPGTGDPSKRVVDLDGFFGLHPGLEPLLDAWVDKNLAIVQACGAPDESRSHFKAMELIERGVDNERGPASGWISRHLSSLDTGNSSPLRAVGIGAQPQRSLRGGMPVTAFRSISDFHYNDDSNAARRMQSALSSLYGGEDQLSLVGRETIKLLDSLQALDPQTYRPRGDRDYPESDFGMGLRQLAMLIKAEVGLEVAAIDLGGWDTHFAQGGVQGLFANLVEDLASGLGAFYADLPDQMGRISIVVMSEFGRRARENGSLGTDHGHGGLMMLLGGGVNGGLVHGRWPGLAPEHLVGPGDLAVTTDYRDVLAELCLLRLNNHATDQVFPDYAPKLRGIFRKLEK